MKATIQYTEKFGHTISLDAASDYPFSFGHKKARMILANIPAIQEFVRKFDAGELATPGKKKRDVAKGHTAGIEEWPAQTSTPGELVGAEQ